MVAPEYVSNDLTSITVSWVNPTDDGGLSLSGFSVQMKAEFKPEYTEVFRGFAYSFKVTFLVPGFSYKFKVAAINAEGLG
jgi:hypothetical protein